MNIQFKKGVLELCVLALLAQKDRYGYELVNEISKNIAISEGTIYPLLKRLKDDGFFTTYIQESQEGPPRKYYQLTELGRETKESLSSEWFSFVEGVNRIIRGNTDHE
ncbi:PadR family transcriptional regulator [Dethiobacter alkaliphilus]|uniref:PadR family transcriptional regulator n=1 Tax=Dethiobacter alkaliphilus TaxID=427926 RepID=UPI0022273268|nr:PadR family transcriptional regulator [Dethiobacter alkaliphilus]MCW3490583.1 PadR family transcriptional regulator [Dethiobacter alkaliphilus]